MLELKLEHNYVLLRWLSIAGSILEEREQNKMYGVQELSSKF